jgi:hypothetical protein
LAGQAEQLGTQVSVVVQLAVLPPDVLHELTHSLVAAQPSVVPGQPPQFGMHEPVAGQK